MSAGRIFLVDLLTGATVTAPGANYVEGRQLEVGRDSRTGLFHHPTSTVRLPLPEWASSGELVTAAGVTTSVWDRIADAVDFEVGIAAVAGGPVTWLHATRVDAREGSEGRSWRALRVPFAEAAELVLRTSADDPRYAWVGWAAPRIDMLVERGACAIVARVPGTTTPGNYASLLTGRLPHRHGLIDEWQGCPGHLPSLPLELARAGYRTVFAASEHELMKAGAGFRDLFEHVVPCHANPWQSGDVTTRALLSEIDELPTGESLLVWAQYFDAHPPRAYPAELVRPYYDLDPRDPANTHDPEEIGKIHGAEVVLELGAALDALRAGVIDARVSYRLRAVAAVLLGRQQTGPDLASHLRSLGADATLALGVAAFARWLDERVDELEAGVVSPALLEWFDHVLPMLQAIESDALSWLEGVCDSRFPRATLKAGCAHVDTQLGALVEALDARGMLDTTTIVFSSPHGELLGEGGYYYQHHPPLEPVLRAPLLLMPVAAAHEPFTAPATTMELIDVMPTLLSLLGLSAPRGLDGRDRLAELRGGAPLQARPLVSISHAGQHVAVASQTHKLVRQRLAGVAPDGSLREPGTDRWFDIADGLDTPCGRPSDAGPLSATADRVVASLG